MVTANRLDTCQYTLNQLPLEVDTKHIKFSPTRDDLPNIIPLLVTGALPDVHIAI